VGRYSIKDILEGESETAQLRRINRHFYLTEESAKATNLHNTGNSGQLALDNPVLYGAERHGIILILITLVNLECVLINFTQTRRDGHQLWMPKAIGDFFSSNRNLLTYVLAGIRNRDAVFKYDGHHRK